MKRALLAAWDGTLVAVIVIVITGSLLALFTGENLFGTQPTPPARRTRDATPTLPQPLP